MKIRLKTKINKGTSLVYKLKNIRKKKKRRTFLNSNSDNSILSYKLSYKGKIKYVNKKFPIYI